MSYLDPQNQFYGRQDILDLLKKRVGNLKEGYRQNVAILGNLYTGKSLLLQNFILNHDDSDVVLIYIDLDNKEFSYFFSRFISSILYHYSKDKGFSGQENLSILLESLNDHIPHTVQVIRKIQVDFKNEKYYNVFLGLLTLVDVFINETGKCCVLIFDEFQNLEASLSSRVYEDLGKKIMTQKKCFYILTSSYERIAKKILSEKLSLLFGNFETLTIGNFDSQNSQKFIDHSLKDKRMGAQLKNFLVDFTGGHPLCLDLICQELVNLSAIHNQSEIYMPLLAQAVENTIFNRWGAISRHFDLILNDLFLGKGNRVVSSVLMSVAGGKNKIEDISLETDVKPVYLKQKLNRLLELNVLVKNGYSYHFQDKLFRYWIKYVYQRRLKDIEISIEAQRRQFREEFNKMIENFKMTSRKDFSSRIVELLNCFDNESYDLNGRKYKLPTFREITPLKIRTENGMFFDVIKASSDDFHWLICLGTESFGENDLSMILAEAKKMGLRSLKCLLISLTDIDENTRLKALSERFWIWNEVELTVLLTLFDKPYIVR